MEKSERPTRRQREAVERPFKAYPYVWIVSNWGWLREVFRSRRDALEFCRRSASENGHTRETWRELYEIRKATLMELGASDDPTN